MSSAAVIGSPISHSRSPAIFSFLAEHMGGFDFRYEAIEVNADQLAAFTPRLRQEAGWVGVNVTLPLKEAALRVVDALSAEARAVGAVNVLRVIRGRLVGDNTDVAGVGRTLAEQRCEVAGKTVWLFGAGGTARAVLYALGELNARKVLVTNRDPTRAQRLCAALAPIHPRTALVPLPSGAAPREPLDLVVNASSAGMKGVPDGGMFAPLERARAAESALAFDLVYLPAFTPFLRQARAVGFRTVGGLDMLVHQALRTWELWMGSDATPLKAPLTRRLRPTRILLTGPMGSGKSTVGPALAQRLGWRFVDTDTLVEQAAGEPIAAIVRRRGERAFRALEHEALERACELDQAVIALGGGALLAQRNLERVAHAGASVWLDCSLETLAARLAPSLSSRPLLAGLAPDALLPALSALMDSRMKGYAQADLRVRTDDLPPAAAAEQVAHELFGGWP